MSRARMRARSAKKEFEQMEFSDGTMTATEVLMRYKVLKYKTEKLEARYRKQRIKFINSMLQPIVDKTYQILKERGYL